MGNAGPVRNRRFVVDTELLSGESLDRGRRELVVLLRRAVADPDRADQPTVSMDRHASRDEQQRPVECGGQGVEEATRLGSHGAGGAAGAALTPHPGRLSDVRRLAARQARCP